MNHRYQPMPIDTSDVLIPAALETLSDLLARNTHEVWAQERMSQGWTYGPVRDDACKTHPDLIPYEELTEEEKAYDHNTSMETLRLILKLGYRILPPEA